MVALSTIIGARTVTLETVRYAIIDPAVRMSKMHYSELVGDFSYQFHRRENANMQE